MIYDVCVCVCVCSLGGKGEGRRAVVCSLCVREGGGVEEGEGEWRRGG